jgi:hypothetical protein
VLIDILSSSKNLKKYLKKDKTMKQFYRLFLAIIFGVIVTGQPLEGCKYVSISTGTESAGEFKYDVMKNGLLN